MPLLITRNPRFKPSSITGCQVWLDATFMDGGSPSRWPDRSGNGNTATTSDIANTAAPAFGSMNGLQTLHFTAANRTLLKIVLGSSFASGNETYFFVGQLIGSTPSATRILSDSTNQRQWLIGGALPNTLCMYAGSTPAIQNLIIPASTPFLGTCVNTSGTLLDYQNGNANSQSLSASTTTLTSFYLGGTNTGTDGEFMDGDIGEVIIYNKALTNNERQQIEGYLAQKWGLVSALPRGHPAYSVTFYPSRSVIQPIITPHSVNNVLLVTSYRIPFLRTIGEGLVLWLDASDTSSMTVSSGIISEWRDKSGLHNHAKGVNSPMLIANSINTCQAVVSTENQYFTGQLSITGDTLTVFAVAQTSRPLGDGNLGNDQRLVSLANGSFPDYGREYGRQDGVIALFNQKNTSTIASWRVTGPIAGNTISTNVPFQAVSKYDGTNGYLWKNGVQGDAPSSSSSGTFGITTYGIGNCPTPTEEYWVGSIGEIVIYNRALSESDQQKVEGYLATKWGLSYKPSEV